ncbi:hydroxymethylbilane synthase [Nitrososphaera viennensis]|uniref:Probable porphobilinogen deaminase n=2 Tax=Nitrososphaera viennensis TaxID=1034015 RepID=A0A060HVH8_9ARCH|nr:hydroxymethylbilane synthase [Nitrososphaera viennensis]AIC17052.1 porphobilinogen deaminase [Nitrososphaera viennensis EN76]UVS68946.1 hydroxymethylbilane synthase [Nitrososphaera viennensis]
MKKTATTIRVGTRGSRLAVAQTELALAALRKAHPGAKFEVVTISTKGDVDRRPLFTMDEKGIFEKEVNEAVKKGQVDFAVHSLKDIPNDLSDELIVACIPKRASPNDVLVNEKGQKLKELAAGSVVGTSSLRRAIQLMKERPDISVKPIRGNVETRVKKVISGEFDAVVLAEAGLTRIGMKDVIVERFGVRDFVPAPGQGAIAIVCRRDDKKTIEMLRSIEDPRSRAEVTAERALIEKVEGGCRFPLGAVAVTTKEGGKITLYASVFSVDGSRNIKVRKTGSAKNAEKLGRSVADLLVKQGAQEMAEGWRRAVEEWNKKA